MLYRANTKERSKEGTKKYSARRKHENRNQQNLRKRDGEKGMQMRKNKIK